jgi:hypothetical protein
MASLQDIVQALLVPRLAAQAAPVAPAPTFLDMLHPVDPTPDGNMPVINPGETWGGQDKNIQHPLDTQMYRVYGKQLQQEDL